jgi:hypothetical protein
VTAKLRTLKLYMKTGHVVILYRVSKFDHAFVKGVAGVMESYVTYAITQDVNISAHEELPADFEFRIGGSELTSNNVELISEIF